MGIRRLKTFRLTCDGRVLSPPDSHFGLRESVPCEATTEMQAASRDEVINDLWVNQGARGLRYHDGWRALGAPGHEEIICPRRDHLDEHSETGR